MNTTKTNVEQQQQKSDYMTDNAVEMGWHTQKWKKSYEWQWSLFIFLKRKYLSFIGLQRLSECQIAAKFKSRPHFDQKRAHQIYVNAWKKKFVSWGEK